MKTEFKLFLPFFIFVFFIGIFTRLTEGYLSSQLVAVINVSAMIICIFFLQKKYTKKYCFGGN